MLTTSFILLKVIAIGLGNVLGSDFAGSLGSLIGDVLSEVAKASWERWKIEKDAKARRNELQEIVQSSNVELSQQINEIVHSELANWVPDARKDAEIYLTQMPDSIRGQMRRPDDPSGTTIPANLALKNSKDLLRLLPAKLAHFKPGDRPLDNVDLELVQLLGIGGFGEVWKARNPNLQNASPVALKFCIDPIAILSLRNEARVLDQVMSQGRHVGIVKLLRTYLSAKIPCLEYELIEGGNLSEFIREWHSSEVKPSPIQAAQVILQLAKIMMVAHDAKPPIVHRDLKPANILVCKRKKEGG